MSLILAQDILKLYLPKANLLRGNIQAKKGSVERGHGAILIADIV
jgi:hypothetical protein